MSASARPRSRCAPPSSPRCRALRSPWWCRPRCWRGSISARSRRGSPGCRSRWRNCRAWCRAKEAAEVKRGLTDGDVNIVIGTHALLSKTIQFSDLGLLVVDEEQHFGVAHKERLKALKADVHVLTLTATPIPRTLQLALTGVREMSLISTPPVDRLAVRTFIMPFDSRGDPRGAAARAVPRRPGVLRGAAHRGPAAHGRTPARDRAGGADWRRRTAGWRRPNWNA